VVQGRAHSRSWCFACVALLLTVAATRTAGDTLTPSARTLVARVVDASTNLPLRCCELFVTDISGWPVRPFGGRCDTLGIGKLEFQSHGKWKVRFRRTGYVDTVLVVVIGSARLDTLGSALRPGGGWIPPCGWGSWEGGAEPEPDTVWILKP